MYDVFNPAVTSAVMSDCRTFRTMLELEDGRVFSGSDIGTWDMEHTMTDEETICIGRVLSRRIELHLRADCVIPKGMTFRVFLYLLDRDVHGVPMSHAAAEEWTYAELESYTHAQLEELLLLCRTRHAMLRQIWKHRELALLTHEQIAALGKTKDTDGFPLEGEYIPFGEFIVSKSTVSGCMTTVTAYDKLRFADALYTPSVTFPAASEQVLEDALQQIGVKGREDTSSGNLLTSHRGLVLDADNEEVLCSDTCTFMIPEIAEGTTCRDILGAIAAYSGGNAVLSRNGTFVVQLFSWATRSLDTRKTDEPEVAEADIGITGLSCILDAEHTLTAGNPENAVELECPYMTPERLHSIWNEWKGRSWRPAQVYERLADPRRDIGDVCQYKAGGLNCTFPITSLIYHFDGGLAADITACGNTESEVL